MRKLTENTIIYLIKKLKDKVESKKKIMKLMFLIEHYDPEEGKLTKTKSIGNTFEIYYYGVFSKEVMECFDKLVKENVVEEFPIKLKKEVEPKLEDALKRKIDKIIEKFGNKSGIELEIETLNMLGIKPYEKEKYFGLKVEEIISKMAYVNYHPSKMNG